MDFRGNSDQKIERENIGFSNNKELLGALSSTYNQLAYIQNGHNALDLAEHFFRCGVEVLQHIENDQYFSILNRSLLALVYSKKGQWGEALTIGEKAFHDALSQGGVITPICEMVLGAILMENGNPNEARERLKNSAALIIGMERQAPLDNSSRETLRHINSLKLEKNKNNHGAVSQEGDNSYLFRIQMFGPFRVFYGNDELDPTGWRTVKSRDLLAYLAHQDKPVSTDQILEDLWPNFNPDKSSALFHTTLYYLRRLLQQFTDEEIIIRGSKRYQLRHGSVLIDRRQFEEAAQRTMKKPITAALANQLETAATHYRGNYLEDLDYQWVIPVQEELKNRNCEIKEELAVYYLQNKMYSRAMIHLRQLITLKPYSEEVLRLLLIAFAGMGDLLAVKKQYAFFAQTISEELNIQPSSEIRAFYKELCDFKPAKKHA